MRQNNREWRLMAWVVILTSAIALTTLTGCRDRSRSTPNGNQRQPLTSPSGKYVLTIPIEREPDYHNAPLWKITISDPDHRHRIPGSGGCDSEAGGLGLTIIRALADSVEHTCTDERGSVIRLVKRLVSPPGDVD